MKHPIQQKLVGVQAVMATPFFENEDIDFDGLIRNANALMDAGIRWLTGTGTVGEFYALSYEEHMKVNRELTQVAHARGCISVPCVGSHSLRTAVKMVNDADRFGADAVLLTPPFYKQQTFMGVKAFLEKVFSETNLPVMFYMCPPFFRTDFTIDQFEEILRMERIVGVKDGTNTLVLFTQLAARLGDACNMIAGANEYTVPFLHFTGHKGFVTTDGNFLPEVAVKMWEAAEKKDGALLEKMRDALLPLWRFSSRHGGIGLIKKGMELRGFAGGHVRLPDFPVKLTAEETEDFRMIIRNILSCGLFC